MTMLATLLLSFAVILVAILAMGIGAFVRNKPIRGSCGGVASGGCELCRGDPDKCPQ